MGAGAIGMMNTVIKNNRNLLRKGERRKNVLGEAVKYEKVEFKTPNASPHTLNKIKLKIQQEQKELRQKQLLVSGLVMTVLLTIILYYI